MSKNALIKVVMINFNRLLKFGLIWFISLANMRIPIARTRGRKGRRTNRHYL